MTSSFFRLAPLAALLLGSSASAATLTLAGTLAGTAGANNDQIDAFRSTSIVKTLDLDNNNVYGSSGVILFATDSSPNGNNGTTGAGALTFTRTINTMPAYFAFSETNAGTVGYATSYGYEPIDNPTLAPSPTVADVESGAALRNTAIGTEVDLFNITLSAGLPVSNMRLGIIFGNIDNYAGLIRLQQITGGTANIPVTQLATGDFQMAFFDITNAVVGDSFRVSALKAAGSTGNANVVLTGFTLEIPEPSRMMLLGMGMLAMMNRRRRSADVIRW